MIVAKLSDLWIINSLSPQLFEKENKTMKNRWRKEPACHSRHAIVQWRNMEWTEWLLSLNGAKRQKNTDFQSSQWIECFIYKIQGVTQRLRAHALEKILQQESEKMHQENIGKKHRKGIIKTIKGKKRRKKKRKRK